MNIIQVNDSRQIDLKKPLSHDLLEFSWEIQKHKLFGLYSSIL
jgi:hypothetical protein